MSESDSRGVGTRRVALRVPEQVKAAFEAKVGENRIDDASRYASVLEKELLAELGIGTPGDLVDRAQSLADTHDEIDREENFCSAPDADGCGVPVQYWIEEGTREQLVNAANTDDTVDSAGEYLAKIMWRYAEDDGYESRAAARISRVEDDTRAFASETDTGTRRTEEIIATADLDADGRTAFTREEFREGVHGARGISAKMGTLKDPEPKYLDRVLDRLGYEWIRGHLFGDPDHHDPDPVMKKPYEYLTEREKVDVIRLDALDRARTTTTSGGYKFKHAEAKAALDNRPNSASGFMQQVADEFDGFRYDDDETVLKVDPSAAAPVDETKQNADGKGGGSTGETTTPDADPVEDSDSRASTTDDDGDGWKRGVVEYYENGAETVVDLPDAALEEPIATVRYDDDRERVTDDDVTAVQTYAEGIATADDDAREADDETEDTGDLEADAQDELDALAAGRPANATAVTDGGEADETDSDDDSPLVANGGTAAASSARRPTLLESRSLGCGPTCPACGGRLRDASGDLAAECIRCDRRVSLVTVAEQMEDTGAGLSEPGD